LDISGKPDRQDGLQAFGTGQIRFKPDFFEGSTDRLILINGWSSSFLRLWFGKSLEPFEDSDGMFAVASAGSTVFIQDNSFFTTGSIFVS
jgi:hypothetical protein